MSLVTDGQGEMDCIWVENVGPVLLSAVVPLCAIRELTLMFLKHFEARDKGQLERELKGMKRLWFLSCLFVCLFDFFSASFCTIH